MFMITSDPEILNISSIKHVCTYYNMHPEARQTIAMIVLGWKLGMNTDNVTSDHLRAAMGTLGKQHLEELIFAVKTNLQ